MTARGILIAAACCALLSPLLAGDVDAQQFVTDDAAVVEHRACQVEGWWGESASWILPACRPFRPLEITLGAGFIRETGATVAEYVPHTLPLDRKRRSQDGKHYVTACFPAGQESDRNMLS